MYLVGIYIYIASQFCYSSTLSKFYRKLLLFAGCVITDTVFVELIIYLFIYSCFTKLFISDVSTTIDNNGNNGSQVFGNILKSSYDTIWNDTIFIYCNWVSSRWQRSVNLCKHRKETAIYKRINSTQHNTKTRNKQNIKQTYTRRKQTKKEY